MKLLSLLFTSLTTLGLFFVPVLGSYPNPWSSQTAMQKAVDQSQHPTQDYYQLCDHAQANFYGWGGSGFPSALDHWNGIGNIDKHPGDMNAPAGAFQFWGGDQYGHIALSMGGGKIASNDILRQGKIDIVDSSLISQKWGLKYLGWTTPTFMGHAYGNSPLVEDLSFSCWAYEQDKSACLKIPGECQWCDLGGMYGDFCAPLGSHNCLASVESTLPNEVQTAGKCAEELTAILDCGDNPFCLGIKVAEIIGECVSVVCPHVPWWAQGAACLIYCADHKEECNKGLTSLHFVEMSDFYSLSSSRQCLMVGAKALYDQRANEIYTGDVNKRWDGIFDNVMPPSAPKYSDCSSAVSWIYWTCFKDGSDFINGENWNDGYTGTLDQHGTKISLSSAQPGDLVFYGNPIDHVAIYIGSGRVISHGSDPVCNCDVHYRDDLNEVRTYLSSSESSEDVECYQPGCSDFDYDTCLTYPYDCQYVDFQGCVDKRDLLEDVDCDNLNRQQCLQHPKECIYIGCSYGCPGCMFRNETSESMYNKALEQDVIPVNYDWKHSAFACCPAAIKDGFECGLDPLCILMAIIKNKCPQKCEADLCHNVPSTCRHRSYSEENEENLLGSIQSEIQHSTSDYWGHSTSAGPDGGVEACAWAVNNIMSISGIRKIGDNPDYVPSVVDALKGGRGKQIQASQAVAGDLVVACGEQHIGVCMEDHCNTIDSNSSSRRCFCWRSGFNFDNYFNCGPATYWRVDN